MTATVPDVDGAMRERIRARLREIAPGLVAAYQFGSTVGGRAGPLSDVDFAIFLGEPDRSVRGALYLPLLGALSDTLRDDRVDLVLLDNAPPAIAHRAIRGALVHSTDERRRVAFEANTLAEYFDLLPLLEYQGHVLFDRIRTGRFGKRDASMIDRHVVQSRIGHIETRLQQLRDRSPTLHQLSSDVEKRDATLYELQTCLEAVSDLGAHFTSALGLGVPQTRAEIFTLLADAQILSDDLANRLGKAMRMRNILVHGYVEVDPERVLHALTHDLADVEEFVDSIRHYLEEHPGASLEKP